MEDVCAPTCGSCSFLGTANTMGCIAEALGMSLIGSAMIPATHARPIPWDQPTAVPSSVLDVLKIKGIPLLLRPKRYLHFSYRR